MKEVSQEMAEKNITTEFIDVWDYIKDEITKEIDEHGLIEAVRLVNPKIIFLVICYSINLNLKFLLEGSGILSEIKMNRDLCIQSRGKILTMSKVQKEFLQTMAKPENITRRLVQIEGQVGSGKTLLGIELIKMKVAFYLRFHGLTADQGKEKIRVIIVIENGLSNDLKTHLEKELSEDIGMQCSLEVHNESLISVSLRKIIETPKDFAKFEQTIILVDECDIGFMEYYTVTDLEEKLKIDYIHCIRYNYFGKNSQILEEKVQIDKESVFVTLLQRQRSSQPILDYSHFMDRHENHPYIVIPDIPNSQDSFPGPNPQWAEVKDAKAFVKYAEENLSEFKGEAMVIRDKREELPEISSLCSKLEWKYCDLIEVIGSESSLVIIYDFDYFHFESFTRAKMKVIKMKVIKVINDDQRGL